MLQSNPVSQNINKVQYNVRLQVVNIRFLLVGTKPAAGYDFVTLDPKFMFSVYNYCKTNKNAGKF